jgi:hypothetical protein
VSLSQALVNLVDKFCRLGYLKKGYRDGEISLAWIKDFDNLTRTKAAGCQRLLVVDGHVSHYTVVFLRYARENGIEVIGYPSHSTHLYQGLDVVIFAAFKRNWSNARDRLKQRAVLLTSRIFPWSTPKHT